MAKISKKDLVFLTTEQIREFLKTEKLKDTDLSPIKEYILNGNKDIHGINSRINRIVTILKIIVIDRFVNETL
jgi:hypothetical protein